MLTAPPYIVEVAMILRQLTYNIVPSIQFIHNLVYVPYALYVYE